MRSRARLLAALLAAGRAAASLDIPAQALARGAHLAAVASPTDPGLQACSTAFAVFDYCVSAIPDFTAAPEATQAACLCCYSTLELDPYYSACASFIDANIPESSTEYSLNSVVATFCAGEGNICGGGGGVGGGSGPTATATPGGGGGSTPTATASAGGGGGGGAAPPACTSVIATVASCSQADPAAFSTASPEELASCFCYSDDGGSSVYGTAFDDYVSSCADWAQTADPTDFSVFQGLEGLCGAFPPQTGSSGPTATGSDSLPEPTTTGGPVFGGGGGGGGSGSGSGGGSGSGSSSSGGGGGGFGSFSNEPTATQTGPGSTAPPSPPGIAPNGAGQTTSGSLVVWLAHGLSVVFSLFFYM